MPRLSIIIPFNNGKKYLDNCLKSLSSINFEDYEIILIDDFSEDNSEKITKKYKNIKYFYTSEKTVGVGNARNLGIEKASGKYIMFLDVDDTIEKDLFKKLSSYMKQNIEMIKYKMKTISNITEQNKLQIEMIGKINYDAIKKAKILYEKGPGFESINGEKAFNQLCFQDNYLDSPCLYLIKKEMFERTALNFEKNVYHEDFGLIPLLIVNAKSVVSTNIYGYNYFQSENSIMRNNEYSKAIKKINDKLFFYDNLNKKLKYMDLDKITEQNILEYYTNSIINSLKDLKYKDRIVYLHVINKKGMIKNLKVRNLKQMLKKLLLSLDKFYQYGV